MNPLLKRSFLSLLCSSTLLLTACGGDDDSNGIAYTDKTKPYAIDAEVSAVVNTHDVFNYKMPSVNNRQISTSALVFTPKGTAPKGGWPVVVWAHGTTGAADQCAPSRNPLFDEEKALIMALVKKGYAVIAPDYEGLGNNAEPHPYLNLKSAAQSILFALSEANQHYKNLSKEWSVVGWSQGGHAALAAAEFSTALVGYTFKGTVAIAPASNLADTLQLGLGVANGYAANGDLAKAVPIASTLYTYAAIVSSGIKAGDNQFQYTQSFVPEKVNIASLAETLCSPELGVKFGSDIQTWLGGKQSFATYKALQDNFIKDPMIAAYLSDNEPAQTPLNKKVYIFQGSADTTVPLPITQKLVGEMQLEKTDVELIVKPNETHSSAVGNHIDEIVGKVDGLMKS